MKSIVKFFPAALALVAFASCSNEDLFGDSSNAQEVQFAKTMDVQVEGINFAGTRAYQMPEASNGLAFGDADKIRVYDDELHKYDVYAYSTSAKTFGTDDDNVSEAKFAILPAADVQYGAWSNDGVKTVVNIPATVNYSTLTVGDNTAYVSGIPFWGEVKAGATKSKLETTLYAMTSLIRVRVNNLAASQNGNYIKLRSAVEPITGMFEATLDPTVATSKAANTTTLEAVEGFDNGKEIIVNLGKEAIDLAYVYLPLIAGSYTGNVTVSYSTAGNNVAVGNDYANVFKTWPGTAAKPAVFERGGAPYGANMAQSSIVATAMTNPLDITNILEANKANGAETILNLSNASVTTSASGAASNYTITIPTDLKNDIVLNFTNTTTGKLNTAAKTLTINGGTAGKTVTFNFATAQAVADANTTNIILNTDSKIVLQGTYANNITATKTGGLTLGDATTAYTPVAAQTLSVAAGDLSVANVAQVNGADVLTISNNAENTVTIGGTITSGVTALTMLKGTANVNAPVATVSTKTNINVAANITTSLEVKEGVSEVNLTKGTITSLVGQGELTGGSFSVPTTIAVKSSGDAAIKAVTTKDNLTFTYSSTWGETAAPTIAQATAVGGVTPIYTAAQLVALDASALAANASYKLETSVTATKAWTPKAVTAATYTFNFDGNGKTITGIQNSLFGALSATTGSIEIKDLTLSTVAIATAANIGAIAPSATTTDVGTITANNVAISSGTIGSATPAFTSANIGGFYGTGSGNLNFADCVVNGTVQGYYNLGGFIGSVGTASNIYFIKADNADGNALKYTTTSNIAFAKTLKVTGLTEDTNCGKVGNLIGSVTADVAVNVYMGYKTTAAVSTYATAFNKYFAANNISATALEFALNTKTVAGETKTFKGVENNYVGYSPAVITANNLKIYRFSNTLYYTEADVNAYND